MVNPNEPHILQLQISGGGCKRVILVSSEDTFTDLQSIMYSCFKPTYTSHWSFTVGRLETELDSNTIKCRCNTVYSSSMDDFEFPRHKDGISDDESNLSDDDEELFPEHQDGGIVTKFRKGARCTLRGANLQKEDEALCGMCPIEFNWNKDFSYTWKIILKDRLPLDPQQKLPFCVSGSGVMKGDWYAVQARFNKGLLNDEL